MGHVFLSYSREDRATAQKISEALAAEGFDVWWDKVLRAGQTYDEVTEGMLRESAVVVVLWSAVSVKSKWVRAEATLGERSSVLVPAMIEDCDRPIMFELVQTADLIGWDGDREAENWKSFVEDVRQAVGAADAVQAPEPQSVAPTPVDATIETTFWTSIESDSDPADLEAYLKRYPNGHYADLARNRLAKLRAPARKAEPQPIPEPARASNAPAPKKKGSGLGEIVAALVTLAALAGAGYFGFTYFSGQKSNQPALSAEAAVSPSVTGKFQDCEDCPAMVALAPGEFDMGSADEAPGHVGNEGPVHKVSLQAFAIGQYEVTYEQWGACVEGDGCRFQPSDRGNGGGSAPVQGVSWADANEYVRWLSNKTGRVYRLPTEAEWEYAARAGTDTAYWWGERFDRSIAPSGRPLDVLKLQANPFGLAGMLGNVREWAEDCYVNNYSDAASDGRAEMGGDCSRRVVRGGSFEDGPEAQRAANRARIGQTVRDGAVGFRIASSDVSPR
ncbi:MAG: SUMF1/EgtB/PvdO family nonheme iron enzyme [Hyphomonadaceae bacterium]